ncbi:hypothetical protein WMF04_28050 [Sorangium sp. So ce260]|uniref:hypothetical protein n=1 Tax=Sorangium sp. So ce260 TaxID=3133291 RepID=UPI003F5EDD26
MLTQARGRSGVALLLFILASALIGDQLAAPPAAEEGRAPLRAQYDVGEAGPLPGAQGAPRAAGAPATAHATRSITP